MSILVTGGAGFVGSNFVMDWTSHSDEMVINLDKLTYAGNLQNLASLQNDKRHIFFKGDIGDTELISNIFSQYRPHAVINFAAESHVDRSIHAPAEFIQTNIVATYNFLETTKAYWQNMDGDGKAKFRFLHVSTDEVYGALAPSDPPFTEMHRYQPGNPYSASKAAGDHLIRAYQNTYDFPVLVTHCSNNYGPFQFPEKLIPLIIHNALAGKPLPLYGDGKQIRDWLFVNDHCTAIRRVLDKGKVGSTYNIGGNNEKSNLEVVETICALLDELKPSANGRAYSEQIIFVSDRPGHDCRYALNAQKIKRELGWVPSESFMTGMRKTVHWYVEHPLWGKSIPKDSFSKQTKSGSIT